MKANILLLSIIGLLIGCNSDDDSAGVNQVNQVLMLKVDYNTNTFEGGKEINFSEKSEVFSIINEYEAPGDFGSVKLIYEEIDEVLFYGTIIWMGKGEMEFPKSLRPASEFEVVLTQDYYYPGNGGFENVFDPNDLFENDFDYTEVWNSVQSLIKVREYLNSNPNQTVKLFIYTPSVGVGNPADWDWIIYMKK